MCLRFLACPFPPSRVAPATPTPYPVFAYQDNENDLCLGGQEESCRSCAAALRTYGVAQGIYY